MGRADSHSGSMSFFAFLHHVHHKCVQPVEPGLPDGPLLVEPCPHRAPAPRARWRRCVSARPWTWRSAPPPPARKGAASPWAAAARGASQIRHPRGPFGQPGQDRPTGRVGQGVEEQREIGIMLSHMLTIIRLSKDEGRFRYSGEAIGVPWLSDHTWTAYDRQGSWPRRWSGSCASISSPCRPLSGAAAASCRRVRTTPRRPSFAMAPGGACGSVRPGCAAVIPGAAMASIRCRKHCRKGWRVWRRGTRRGQAQVTDRRP
jgi:hypothetical protein